MAFESIKKALFPKEESFDGGEEETYETEAKDNGNKMILVEPRALNKLPII